jgi:N-acetyl-gamma-glutamyl-phosphate reductase
VKNLPQEIRDQLKERNTGAEKQEEVSSFQKDNNYLSIKFLLDKISDINYRMKNTINIAIAGATGFVGLELIKILENHPKAKIIFLFSKKSIGKSINFFDNKIKSKKLPKLTDIKKINWKKIEIIFSAQPNGEAQKIAKIIPNRVKLIDLSADFRIINPKVYKKWYGINHKINKRKKSSIYAISEFTKKKTTKF